MQDGCPELINIKKERYPEQFRQPKAKKIEYHCSRFSTAIEFIAKNERCDASHLTSMLTIISNSISLIICNSTYTNEDVKKMCGLLDVLMNNLLFMINRIKSSIYYRALNDDMRDDIDQRINLQTNMFYMTMQLTRYDIKKALGDVSKDRRSPSLSDMRSKTDSEEILQ